MSAGTRSSAITAQAPASSAIFACSGVTTSMITPPFNISARPVLTLKVARSAIATHISWLASLPTRSRVLAYGLKATPLRRVAQVQGGRERKPRPQAPPAPVTGPPAEDLLQFVGADAVFVDCFVAGVEAVGESLDEGHQRRVGAREGGAVRGEVESLFGVLADL